MVDLPIIHAVDVCAKYSEDESGWVLSGVTFELRPGEVLFLCGPNGSGKTSLLRVLEGTLEYRGKITGSSDGRVPDDWEGFRDREISRIPQAADEAVARSLKVSELVRVSNRKRIEGFCRSTGSQWILDSSKKMIGELSGGQLQLLVGVVVLAAGKSVVLLDEVFRSLDHRTAEEYWELVRRFVEDGRRAAVVVSHDLTFAKKKATRIMVLQKGRIAVMCSPDEITLEQLALRISCT